MITKRLLCFIGLLAFANLSMAKPPIILAAVYNLSGSQSSLDKASLQGAKLAVQKINAKGGVLGRQLVLQVKDGKSQVSILKKLGEQLAKNKNIQLAFGLSDSGMLRTFLPVYLKSGKLFVNSGATGANLTQQFPKRFFLTTFTNNVQASGGAKFIMDQLHRKKTIVLYQGDMSYARNLANYFVDAYQHAGGKVTDKRSVGKIISIETLNSLKHQPLSVIYLAAAPNRVPNLIKQIRQAKITLPIMGGDSYVVNDITALSATVADSVYFTTLGSYDRNFMDPSMVAFVKYYQKRLGEKPTNIYSAVGYDTVNILAAAMKKAKSTEPTKVATALKSMQDFSALTGDLNIGTPVVNSMVTVVKVISGKARIAALVIPQYIPQPIQFIARKKNDSNT